MSPPIPMLHDRTILIAHHDRFVADYMRRALEGAGADILDSVRTVDAADTFLRARSAPISACVGSVLYDAATADLLGPWRVRLSAMLFIGNAEPANAWPPYDYLPYPFASYQIADAVSGLLS